LEQILDNHAELLCRISELESELARMRKTTEALMNRVEFSSDTRSSSYNLFVNNILLQNKIREHTSQLAQINALLQQEIIEHRSTELILRQEKDFLASVFNLANIWILVLDKNLSVVRINHTCEKATGLINDDICGMNLRDLYNYEETADSSDLYLTKQEKAALGKIKPIRFKNGKLFYVAWQTSTIENLSNNTEFIICCGIDFTNEITSRHRNSP
jgi:PAS domain S-box-containing protein